MVISWDKNENNPNPIPPATEITPPPAPAAAALADRPLGRRVTAALVDLGLLSGLYIIISLIVGPTSPAIGPLSISLFNVTFTSADGSVFTIGLYGAWATLYLILLPCYYFALEALTGRTIGKALLGLRVTHSDGARPASGPIAIRTLLRLFDGLPAFYLAGFIVMLVTGRQQRQRLGDLAADTVVVRAARSSRSLALAVTCVAVVVGSAVGLSALRLSSSAGSQTYRGHGISFSYPAGWGQGHGTSIVQTGNRLFDLAVGPGADADVVIIDSYRLTKAVGPQNLGATVGEVSHLLQGWVKHIGGAVLRGPQQITLATMPGVRFLIGGYLRDGTPIQSILTFGFSGTTEYLINCQTTRAAASAMSAGCDAVLRTFRTTSPPATQASTAPPATLPPPPLSAAQWRHGLRLLLAQMNRTLEVGGVVTRAKLRVQVSQLRRCAPGLARLGKPAPQLRPADRFAIRACAQFTRAARCYGAAARAYDPVTVTARFNKSLNCGDAAATAGSGLIGEAVAVSAPS